MQIHANQKPKDYPLHDYQAQHR